MHMYTYESWIYLRVEDQEFCHGSISKKTNLAQFSDYQNIVFGFLAKNFLVCPKFSKNVQNRHFFAPKVDYFLLFSAPSAPKMGHLSILVPRRPIFGTEGAENF